MSCADYDLCTSCYHRRGELHPEHDSWQVAQMPQEQGPLRADLLEDDNASTTQASSSQDDEAEGSMAGTSIEDASVDAHVFAERCGESQSDGADSQAAETQSSISICDHNMSLSECAQAFASLLNHPDEAVRCAARNSILGLNQEAKQSDQSQGADSTVADQQSIESTNNESEEDGVTVVTEQLEPDSEDDEDFIVVSSKDLSSDEEWEQ